MSSMRTGPRHLARDGLTDCAPNRQGRRIKSASWILGLDVKLFANYDKVQEFRFIRWGYRFKAIY